MSVWDPPIDLHANTWLLFILIKSNNLIISFWYICINLWMNLRNMITITENEIHRPLHIDTFSRYSFSRTIYTSNSRGRCPISSCYRFWNHLYIFNFFWETLSLNFYKNTKFLSKGWKILLDLWGRRGNTYTG